MFYYSYTCFSGHICVYHTRYIHEDDRLSALETCMDMKNSYIILFEAIFDSASKKNQAIELAIVCA